MRNKLGKKNLEPIINSLKISLVVNTNSYILLIDKPPRKTTKIPLSTNIRTRSHDNVKTILLSKIDPSLNISNTLKVENTLLRLVKIPSNISLNSIQTTSNHLLEDILPTIGVDSEVVEGTRDVLEGLTIHVEGLVLDLESTLSESDSKKESKNEELVHYKYFQTK